MNFKAFLNTVSNKAHSLPIVILYVTEGCNLDCMMCSYRDRLPNELSLEEIERLADELHQFGLKRIVFSGGEPLLRRDFPDICKAFGRDSVEQTLLTNGLLLGKRVAEISQYLDEVIVSLDGATALGHNEIRGVNSFDRVVESIPLIKKHNPHTKVSIRTVVQKKNFRQLPELIDLCLDLKVDRVSFLAVDVLSSAFGRDQARMDGKAGLLLTPDEVKELREALANLSRSRAQLFKSGFLSDSTSRLEHIAEYFEALTNGGIFPRVHCNAPMVSAVITSTGELLPCFFLPSVGNIRNNDLGDLLNSGMMRDTRTQVRRYSLPACHTCVCSLKVKPVQALANLF